MHRQAVTGHDIDGCVVGSQDTDERLATGGCLQGNVPACIQRDIAAAAIDNGLGDDIAAAGVQQNIADAFGCDTCGVATALDGDIRCIDNDRTASCLNITLSGIAGRSQGQSISADPLDDNRRNRIDLKSIGFRDK